MLEPCFACLPFCGISRQFIQWATAVPLLDELHRHVLGDLHGVLQAERSAAPRAHHEDEALPLDAQSKQMILIKGSVGQPGCSDGEVKIWDGFS